VCVYMRGKGRGGGSVSVARALVVVARRLPFEEQKKSRGRRGGSRRRKKEESAGGGAHVRSHAGVGVRHSGGRAKVRRFGCYGSARVVDARGSAKGEGTFSVKSEKNVASDSVSSFRVEISFSNRIDTRCFPTTLIRAQVRWHARR